MSIKAVAGSRSLINTSNLLLALMALVFLNACATGDRYHWGRYESLVYAMYNDPNEAVPERQISLLTQDIQRAQSQGKPVPPGVFAHLGFQYALAGDSGAAEQAFDTEKRLYPESKVLIEGMQARARKALERKPRN